MSTTLVEMGAFYVTRCCAKCDACGRVLRALQVRSSNGYATACFHCLGLIFNKLPLEVQSFVEAINPDEETVDRSQPATEVPP